MRRIWRGLSPEPFQAKYSGLGIFAALQEIDDDKGFCEVAALPYWEYQVIMHLRISEKEYILIPKTQRARMVVTLKLQEWFQVLEHERYQEEQKARRGKK